jgi:hypothetical protein
VFTLHIRSEVVPVLADNRLDLHLASLAGIPAVVWVAVAGLDTGSTFHC